MEFIFIMPMPYKGGRAAAQKRYNSKPEQVKNRTSRNAARAKMEQAGRVRKGDGKDVAHKNNNPKDNSKGNLAVQSKSKNRSHKLMRK